MNRQFAQNIVCAAVVLFAISNQGFAQRDAASKILDDGYYFYAGETYGAHANDHAQILNQVSETGEFLPSYVVKEHATEIRNNIESAKRSYENVSEQAKQDPDTAQKLNKIATHHEKALELCDQIDEQAGNEQGSADTINGLTVNLQTELNNAHQAQKQLPKQGDKEQSNTSYQQNN